MTNEEAFSVTELGLAGVKLLRPKQYDDERGWAVNLGGSEAYRALGIAASFIEDFTSFSKKDVIRGFHFQKPPYAQDKLVRCAAGAILDVIADCDPASATYAKHISVPLNGDTQELLFIPSRYAHAYSVTGEYARLEYKLSAPYHPESVGGARYDDPVLAVAWPIADPILSEKDQTWPALSRL